MAQMMQQPAFALFLLFETDKFRGEKISQNCNQPRAQNQCDQIWRNFKRFWYLFDGLFSIRQNFEPNSAKQKFW